MFFFLLPKKKHLVVIGKNKLTFIDFMSESTRLTIFDKYYLSEDISFNLRHASKSIRCLLRAQLHCRLVRNGAMSKEVNQRE